MTSTNSIKIPNVQCNQYLIDGKVTKWTGPSSDVFSNIYLSKNKNIFNWINLSNINYPNIIIIILIIILYSPMQILKLL